MTELSDLLDDLVSGKKDLTPEVDKRITELLEERRGIGNKKQEQKQEEASPEFIPIIDKTTHKNRKEKQEASRREWLANQKRHSSKKEQPKGLSKIPNIKPLMQVGNSSKLKLEKSIDRLTLCPSREDKESYLGYGGNPIFFLKKEFGAVSQRILPQYEEKLNRARKFLDYHKLKLEMFRPIVNNKNVFQITRQEQEMLYAYKRALQNRGEKILSFCSGNGIGKTRITSFIMIHFMVSFYKARIIYISPQNSLSNETKSLIKTVFSLSDKYSRRIKEKYGVLYFGGLYDSSIKFVSSKAGLHGVHGENLLVVADEASDLSDDILKSVNRLLGRGNNIFIMLGNPKYNKGFFYDTCHSNSEHIATLHFDAEQSPLINRDYVQKAKDLYGEYSDEYIRRVKGRFPKEKNRSDELLV